MARSHVQQTNLAVRGPSAVSVGTAATLLTGPDGGRCVVDVFNNHATAAIYVGGSGVTTTSGRPVLAQTNYRDEFGNSALYGVVASGTADVRVTTWNLP